MPHRRKTATDPRRCAFHIRGVPHLGQMNPRRQPAAKTENESNLTMNSTLVKYSSRIRSLAGLGLIHPSLRRQKVNKGTSSKTSRSPFTCLKTTKRCGLFLSLLFALATGADHAHAQLRVRRNIMDLSSSDQQLFADANLPQNRYEEYVRVHDNNAGIAHGGNFFLPWHRQLLFQMENDVRGLGGKYASFT